MWDTALKFFFPVLQITSPDHLESIAILELATRFFDVRVFHPNTSSYRSTNILALYRQHEMAEKREYGDWIREVEYAVFIPLVFSTKLQNFHSVQRTYIP